MSPRRSSRPRTTPPAARLFQPSLSGWYAAWKARRETTPTLEAAPVADELPTGGGEVHAVAEWLTAGAEDRLSPGPA